MLPFVISLFFWTLAEGQTQLLTDPSFDLYGNGPSSPWSFSRYFNNGIIAITSSSPRSGNWSYECGGHNNIFYLNQDVFFPSGGTAILSFWVKANIDVQSGDDVSSIVSVDGAQQVVISHRSPSFGYTQYTVNLSPYLNGSTRRVTIDINMYTSGTRVYIDDVTLSYTQPITSAIMTTAQKFTTLPLTTSRITTSAVTSQALTTDKFTSQSLTSSDFTTQDISTQSLTSQSLTSSELTTQDISTQSLTSQSLTSSELTTQAVSTQSFTTQPLTTQKPLEFNQTLITFQIAQEDPPINPKKDLNEGTIAGIIIACISCCILSVAVVLFLASRREHKKKEELSIQDIEMK